jgi:dTDP-4-dehydrorhamnose reductase
LRILLTGKDGQVGWELARRLPALGEVTALSRAELDLADPIAILERVRAVKPDVIVNAAAYTAVDRAESERDQATLVNAAGPGFLAAEAHACGALLVHYSTDYVFDGRKPTPYVETDPCNPLSVYGQSKLAGERAIQAAGCRHLILRTAWVYASRGRNFLLTMLRLAKERPELRVVDDQTGSPTWAREIAIATVALLSRRDALEGTYHLTASGATTWCGFAREIVKLAGLETPVHAITTADYPTPAQRPRNSVLSTERLRQDAGLALPDWRESLASCLAELRGGAG